MPRLNRDTRYSISFILDGREVTGQAEPRMLLSDYLRQEQAVNAVHVACEHGVCGACTVLLDGKAVRACLMFAVQASGRRVDTAAGLADKDGALNDLQRAFRRHHALQCGYCTPGILMSVTDFLSRNPAPSEEALREMLSGHLCRCTGYTGMVRAVLDLVAERASGVALAE
ncbi:MAG: (2Fe-2S)-binding protein [Alphaproteobacteria bacterium]|jgi:2-furoyl-CoA dehydrogenase 2Fe-2S iron sulfur subunit|nr:(2Fe-2S)-binding protein [Alphaproteobacteria bacterium]